MSWSCDGPLFEHINNERRQDRNSHIYSKKISQIFKKGAMLGSPLAAILFNAVVDVLFRTLDRDARCGFYLDNYSLYNVSVYCGLLNYNQILSYVDWLARNNSFSLYLGTLDNKLNTVVPP